MTPYFSSKEPTVELIDLANRYYTISLVIVIMIAGPFSVPLSYLVFVQAGNIANNTTTNARFSKYRKL